MRKRTWGLLAAVLFVAVGIMGCSSSAPRSTMGATAPVPTAPVLAAAPADAGDNAYLTFYRKKRIVSMALNTRWSSMASRSRNWIREPT